MVIPKKDQFDEQAIDSAFEKIIESKTENMETHLIYAGHDHSLVKNRLELFILKSMKIMKVMVTILNMMRNELVTKEKMEDYCKGKQYEKESFNEDLESFFGDIRSGEETKKTAFTYFFPRPSEEELELVEGEDLIYMSSFVEGELADVDEAEMVLSESDSKYLHVCCTRITYTIENSLKREASSSFSCEPRRTLYECEHCAFLAFDANTAAEHSHWHNQLATTDILTSMVPITPIPMSVIVPNPNWQI